MPGILRQSDSISKKRKYGDPPGIQLPLSRESKVHKRSASPELKASTRNCTEHGTNSRRKIIEDLEQGIRHSQTNLNDVARLNDLAAIEVAKESKNAYALVSLCRVFARFLITDKLNKQSAASQNEHTIVEWTRHQYESYKGSLQKAMLAEDEVMSDKALSLAMQLVKAENDRNQSHHEAVWTAGVFNNLIIDTVLQASPPSSLVSLFCTKYVAPYDDVRHFFFRGISSVSKDQKDEDSSRVRNALRLMLAISAPDDQDGPLRHLFCSAGMWTSKKISYSAHRKAAQKAWLAVLNTGLDRMQRKRILTEMTNRVVPWFQSTELLMDFLTDSFNVGGSTTLLALSGLFHLMQRHNLDYPDFYTKLYSMLDDNILHSKHRSRFFRLMDVFLSSTHLPAALVASFIKRLSRLSLEGPPAAIVAVVPWIYNMFKSHPTTTFMMHRISRDDAEARAIHDLGADDPFDMNEQDPMETGAIDSCVWELVTLSQHYHPNVASIAKIITQQFTKARYNLDDFLDYSYASLIEGELHRELKKTPVAEWQISKTVFAEQMMDDDGEADESCKSMMERMLSG